MVGNYTLLSESVMDSLSKQASTDDREVQLQIPPNDSSEASHSFQSMLFTPIVILPDYLRCNLLSSRPCGFFESDLRHLTNVMKNSTNYQTTIRALTCDAWMSFCIVNNAAS